MSLAFRKLVLCWERWHRPGTPAFLKERQENQKFKDIFGYKSFNFEAWLSYMRPYLKGLIDKKGEENKEGEEKGKRGLDLCNFCFSFAFMLVLS